MSIPKFRAAVIVFLVGVAFVAMPLVFLLKTPPKASA